MSIPAISEEILSHHAFGDIHLFELTGHIGLCLINRPPNNFFDEPMIHAIAQSADLLEKKGGRAMVLASEGKHFCAGANFTTGDDSDNAAVAKASERSNPLYAAAKEIFQAPVPIIGAIQGAAIGGGLGVAVSCDFRVGSEASRFAGNFVKLGIHPGFGLTYALPRLIGVQKASLLLLSGRRIKGQEAYDMGLLDELAPAGCERQAALALARDIATGAPLVIKSIRESMRENIGSHIQRATDLEFLEQRWMMQTKDHQEGVRSVAAREPGKFTGK